MVLNDFHPGVLYSLTDEYLQDGLCLDIKVEKPKLLVVKLDGLVITILVWYKLGSAWLVDIKVSRNRVFIHHVVLVVKRCPVKVFGDWTLKLLLLLLYLVETSLLCHLLLLLCDLLLQLLLLLYAFQVVSLGLLLGSLLFGLHGVGLHI